MILYGSHLERTTAEVSENPEEDTKDEYPTEDITADERVIEENIIEDTIIEDTIEIEATEEFTKDPAEKMAKEPQEEQQEESAITEPSSDSLAVRLADDTKVASSLTEFKSFLADSTTTTIYLNTDILIPVDGLPINPDKTNLVIDGTSPVDGLVHTITDYDTVAYKDTIKLERNSTLKSIFLKNIVIYGKNYYGTVCISDAVTNVLVAYENVRYYGPQLTYNTNGTAHYKNCTIQIGKFGGVSPTQELAEAKNVVFEGDTTVTQVNETPYEIIYSLLSGTVEIAANANITIKTYSNGGFFFGGAYSNFILHERSQFKFYGANRFWEYIPFQNVTVKSHASLYIEITEGLSYNAMLHVAGSLNVESDAELILINRRSSVYWPLYMNGGNANFMNPRRVVLYSPDIRPIYYGIQGKLSINAQQIRYWKTAAYIPGAGGFHNPPDYHWNKFNNSSLTLSGTTTVGATGNFTSFTSNYDPSNTIGSSALNASTFNLPNARVLAFGRLTLTAQYTVLNEETAQITGLSESGADIQISLTDGQAEETVFTGKADVNGNFQFSFNHIIADGTIIKVRSNKQFLTSETEIIVNNNLFQFQMELNDIEFETTYLSHEVQLVKRNDPDWNITITDGRGVGNAWRLTAKLIKPLHYMDESDGTTYTLDNALVFIDGSGNIHTLTTDSEVPIYAQTTASEMEITRIFWKNDKGILALIEPKTAQTDIPYTGSILWILRNAP